MPLKAAAQYVGGLAIAIFFVVLLSFTFSFLGTIFCAAVSGMMLGALRTHKWQAIPVSLLFPAVIFALLKGMRTALAERQVLLVSLACLAIFWATYAVGAALFFFERKKPRAMDSSSVSPASLLPFPGVGARTGFMPGAMPESEGHISLDMLQGDWSGPANGEPQFRTRRISIRQERLILFGVDANGDARIIAQGEVRLGTHAGLEADRLSRAAAEDASDTLTSI